MSNNIHVDDVGTIFKVLIKDDDTGAALDIRTATTLQLKFKKPQSPTVTKTAVFTTDGSDGYIQYPVIAGDLDISGKWSVQGFVSGGGYDNSSEIGTFTVHPNL